MATLENVRYVLNKSSLSNRQLSKETKLSRDVIAYIKETHEYTKQIYEREISRLKRDITLGILSVLVTLSSLLAIFKAMR